jgi:protein-L-isoaspartate(D-aspartate) O-methyltransferase
MGREEEAQKFRVDLVEHLAWIGDVKTPRVRDALLSVPRHRFVPGVALATAYDNRAVAIGYEQTISQPSIVAIMTEALRLEGNERVLEIGTGSGYQAAVLSVLAKEVYTIEVVPALADVARRLLVELGYTNVHLRIADGSFGWVDHAPYERIIITAATPHVPAPLFAQLHDDGILIAPVGTFWGQSLLEYHKTGGSISTRNLGSVSFVPLVGAEA